MKEVVPFSLLVLLSCIYVSQGAVLNGTVYVKGSTTTYKLGVVDPAGGAAYAVFNDSLLESGWGQLHIKAGYGQEFPGNQQLMFAAGFIEGALTQKHIFNQYKNLKPVFGISDDVMSRIKAFFVQQELWMVSMIEKAPKTDAYWRHMSYVYQQYKGLMEGYHAVAPADQELDVFAFQLMSGAGDVLDLVHALKKVRPNPLKMAKEELKTFNLKNSHCSALIKILPGYENMFMSHSSWFAYATINRIFKYYQFGLKDPATKMTTVGFSSYPGYLNSLDDYYLMDNGVVMIQTTNNVYNMSLYDLVQPTSNLAWYRVRVAHMMSSGGKQWADIMSRYNSGTYNNQYMILDLKKVSLNNTIHDGALWVVEQIPGLVESADVTDVLRTGYWPSYNVPFFESIFNMSGYPEVVASKGTDFSYQLAPRAKIFRRDANQVHDMESMKAIMRYNDYEHDPYSEGNSCEAICCRGDLQKDPVANGCYDTKVSDFSMARDLNAFVINGPTEGTGLGPFSWSKSAFNSSSHIGLPDVFNFPFMRVKPMM